MTTSSVDVGKHAADDNGALPARPSGSGEPVLSVRGLGKHFPIRSSGLIRRKVGDVHAVCDVSFDIYERETLCIVGESGCGKTTTGRLVLNLIPASHGEVIWRGQDLTKLSSGQMRPLRRDMQIVFQDPFASLDPRMTVNELVAEPLRIHGTKRPDGRGAIDEREVVGPVRERLRPTELARQRLGRSQQPECAASGDGERGPLGSAARSLVEVHDAATPTGRGQRRHQAVAPQQAVVLAVPATKLQ